MALHLVCTPDQQMLITSPAQTLARQPIVGDLRVFPTEGAGIVGPGSQPLEFFVIAMALGQTVFRVEADVEGEGDTLDCVADEITLSVTETGTETPATPAGSTLGLVASPPIPKV